MAAIRIVDDWLRCPAAPPSHWRSVMVVAEKWGEQRVLMRAYADSRDQTRPTIMLHSVELAIGPAGLDANGPWGIHVGEPVDGRAQEIKHHFEAAARRLAGSRGNPPRLIDEEPTFELEPTGHWSEGAPPVLPPRSTVMPTPRPAMDARGQVAALPATARTPSMHLQAPAVDFVAPVAAARVGSSQHATYVTHSHAALHKVASNAYPQAPVATAPSNPGLRLAPLPRGKDRSVPPPIGRTALGYASGAGAQSAVIRLGLLPQVSARLGRLVDRVVPGDFQIDGRERTVLNALGQADLVSARAIGQLLNVTDAVTWMEGLTRKLESYGLDLVEPADPDGNEPTYRLRR